MIDVMVMGYSSAEAVTVRMALDPLPRMKLFIVGNTVAPVVVSTGVARMGTGNVYDVTIVCSYTNIDAKYL